MKKLFTLFTLLFITATFAQQRLIAVKGTVTDAIAYNLTEAIGLAQPGDKIYYPGGYFSYTPAIEIEINNHKIFESIHFQRNLKHLFFNFSNQ